MPLSMWAMRPTRENLYAQTNTQKKILGELYSMTEKLQGDEDIGPDFTPLYDVRDSLALAVLHNDVTRSEDAARQLAKVQWSLKQVSKAILLIEAQQMLEKKVAALSDDILSCLSEDREAVQTWLAQAVAVYGLRTDKDIAESQKPKALDEKRYELQNKFRHVVENETHRYIAFSPRDLSERIETLRADIVHYAVQKMHLNIAGAQIDLEKAYHLKRGMELGWIDDTGMRNQNFQDDIESLQDKLATTLDDISQLEQFIDKVIPIKDKDTPRPSVKTAQYAPHSIGPLANL